MAGTDVGFDAAPYTVAVGPIQLLFPPAMATAAAQLAIAARTGMNGASVLIGTVSGDGRDEAPLEAIPTHPLCCIGTNAASLTAGPQNPSVTGAFPRFLGRFVRERSLLSLEDAVRRMTSLPAARLGLSEVGRIAEGCRADLTVFDPARVRDAVDPERPDAVPEGIRTVIVAGVPVLVDGHEVGDASPGRVLR